MKKCTPSKFREEQQFGDPWRESRIRSRRQSTFFLLRTLLVLFRHLPMPKASHQFPAKWSQLQEKAARFLFFWRQYRDGEGKEKLETGRQKKRVIEKNKAPLDRRSSSSSWRQLDRFKLDRVWKYGPLEPWEQIYSFPDIIGLVGSQIPFFVPLLDRRPIR